MILFDDDMSPEEFLNEWIKACKEDFINNPEKYISLEPGFYIGGQKLNSGDTIVTNNWGYPVINRAGNFE